MWKGKKDGGRGPHLANGDARPVDQESVKLSHCPGEDFHCVRLQPVCIPDANALLVS